jgi:PAP2 superfamily/Vanadium chloroperoxidase N-terminal domain
MNTRSFNKTGRHLLCAIALATLATTAQAAPAASWCADRCDQVILDWNAHTHQVITAADGYQLPLPASRTLAMVHLAMHDAVNAVVPRYRAHTYQAAAQRGAVASAGDAAVAAAVAAHDVLAALYPKQKELLRALRDSTLNEAGLGAAVERAKAAGAAAAAAMLAARADDGAAADEAYTPGTRPGEYRHVPGFDFLVLPQWRSVKPFSMRAPSQFRVAPPPALDSAAYAVAFEEVKAGGSKAEGARRSADQTQYAAYWYEFSEAGWNRIARVVARERKQNLWQRARSFALLNAAMADAYIAGWDSKLHHNLWRPVTAIQLAADDGNPATTPDRQWMPLLTTPPVQDYPSTHSALGAAAATVLAHAFGSDRVAFTMASPTASAEAPTRRFDSFSAAARENADSRVRAGLHFRFATEQGLRLGEQVGAQAARELLAPLS